MAIIKAQVRLQRDTLLPEDAVVNTFHFLTDVDTMDPSDPGDIKQMLTDLYTLAVPGEAASLMSRMSRVLNGPAEVRMYNLADAEPRAAIHLSTFATTWPTAGDALPSEVALVAQIRGGPTSGVDIRRQRGRIYFGPFNVDPGTTDAADNRPSLTLRNIIGKAMQRMANAGNTAGTPRLCVWSGTGLSASIVNNIRVNDAWDTQRRRGAKPTGNLDFPRA